MLDTTHAHVDVEAAGGAGQVVTITFQFHDSDQLQIVTIDDDDVETPLTPGVDYTVVEPVAPLPNTSSVTIDKVLTAGHTIRVRRIIELKQIIDFIGQGAYTPASLAKGLDLLCMMLQQTAEGIVPAGAFVHGDLPGGSLHDEATDDLAGFMPAALYTAAIAHIASEGSYHPLADEDTDGLLSSDLYTSLTELASTVPLATTATMNIYVDAATGSDVSGDGSTGLPYSTIQHAIDQVPFYVLHTVTIYVAAGTYTEKLRVDKYIGSTAASGKLLIQGAYIAVTPTTGVASGTIATTTAATASVNQVLNMSGVPTWTVNDFRGMYVRALSGAASGRVFPIASNTATTIELATSAPLANGVTFDIVRPAVIVVGGAGSSDVALFVSSTGRQIVGGAATPTLYAGLLVSGMEMQAARPARSYGGVGLDGCTIRYTGTQGVEQIDGVLSMERCVVIPTSGTGYGVIVRNGTQCYIAGCFLRGNGNASGVLLFGVPQMTIGVANDGNTIENYPASVTSNGGAAATTCTDNAFRTATVGYDCGGQTQQRLINCRISDVSYVFRIAQNPGAGYISSGIGMDGGSIANVSIALAYLASSKSSLELLNVTASAGVQLGVLVEGSHNRIQILGTTNLVVTTYAWFCSLPSSFNSFEISSTATISGGTADISLDNGTTPLALSALRADADKTIVDAAHFNRAWAQ